MSELPMPARRRRSPETARVLPVVAPVAATAAVAATLQVKVTEVQSGNTVVVSNTSRAMKVRLKGIAPPEADQPFSDVARDHLRMLVLDKAVALDYTNLADGYFLAKISINGIDVGSQMLRDGAACGRFVSNRQW